MKISANPNIYVAVFFWESMLRKYRTALFLFLIVFVPGGKGEMLLPWEQSGPVKFRGHIQTYPPCWLTHSPLTHSWTLSLHSSTSAEAQCYDHIMWLCSFDAIWLVEICLMLRINYMSRNFGTSFLPPAPKLNQSFEMWKFLWRSQLYEFIFIITVTFILISLTCKFHWIILKIIIKNNRVFTRFRAFLSL